MERVVRPRPERTSQHDRVDHQPKLIDEALLDDPVAPAKTLRMLSASQLRPSGRSRSDEFQPCRGFYLAMGPAGPRCEGGPGDEGGDDGRDGGGYRRDGADPLRTLAASTGDARGLGLGHASADSGPGLEQLPGTLPQ